MQFTNLVNKLDIKKKWEVLYFLLSSSEVNNGNKNTIFTVPIQKKSLGFQSSASFSSSRSQTLFFPSSMVNRVSVETTTNSVILDRYGKSSMTSDGNSFTNIPPKSRTTPNLSSSKSNKDISKEGSIDEEDRVDIAKVLSFLQGINSDYISTPPLTISNVRDNIN